MTPTDSPYSGMKDEDLIEAVATKVMGWTPQQSSDAWEARKRPHTWFDSLTMRRTPMYKWNPLTNWNCTMDVVERLRKMEWRFWFTTFISDVGNPDNSKVIFDNHYGKEYSVEDFNPQRAICLAALASLSPSQNDPH